MSPLLSINIEKLSQIKPIQNSTCECVIGISVRYTTNTFSTNELHSPNKNFSGKMLKHFPTKRFVRQMQFITIVPIPNQNKVQKYDAR